MENKKALLVAALIVLLGFPVLYLLIRTSGSTDIPKEQKLPAANAAPANDIKSLESAANSEPTFGNLLNLGLAYINNKMPGKGIEPLKKALELNPKSAVAYNDLGVAYTMLQQYQNGIDACTNALQIDASFQLAKNNLKWATDEKDKVIAVIQTAEKTPNNQRSAAFYLDLGMDYLKIGSYDKSIEAWNKVLKMEPKSAAAVNNIGTAYMMKNQYDDAVRIFTKALQLDPNGQLAKNNLAWALDEKTKAETAKKK